MEERTDPLIIEMRKNNGEIRILADNMSRKEWKKDRNRMISIGRNNIDTFSKKAYNMTFDLTRLAYNIW